MSTTAPPPPAVPAPPAAEVDAVERILLDDPAGAFARSDAATRARCAGVVRAWAERTGRTGAEVAAAALARARAAASAADTSSGTSGDPSADPWADPAAHVGWWIIGPGADELAAELGVRPGPRERVQGFVARHPALCQLAVVGVALLAYAAGVVALGRGWGAAPAAALLFWAVALPVFHDAGALLALVWLRPFVPRRELARLDFSAGIPDHCRTLVAIPTLFTSVDGAREQVEQLERLAYSNPDPNLRAVLLSDFADAGEETLPGDLEMLRAAAEAVHRTNQRHPCPHGPRFFVLHRARSWNPAEGVWMGWERKRGKFEELNRLLLDPGPVTPFRWVSGDFGRVAAERPFRYVIALDEDSWLVAGHARELVGIAAHPLNRPRPGPGGSVREGYGVVQPTLVLAPPEPMTRFAWVTTGSAGPMRHVDFGFDLYGDASWTGKGLYDVHAFAAANDGAYAENAVLSHDYLEGYRARTCTADDVGVVERFPGRYLEQAPQRHRWIRGDWQNLPWLVSRRVRGADGALHPNPLGAAARYRILRLLFFEVKPVSRLVLLLLAWLWLPGPAAAWTLLAFADLWTMLAVFAWTLARSWLRPRDDGPRAGAAWDGVLHHLLGTALDAAVLPSQAALAAGAIGRALWRMTVSRKKLLEWTAQSQVQRAARGEWRAYARALRASTVTGPVAFAAVWALAPGRVWVAAPFAAAWTVAWALVAWLDRPLRGGAPRAAAEPP